SATQAVALDERKEGKRKLEDTGDQPKAPTPRLVVPGFLYENGSYEISGSTKRPKGREHVSTFGAVPSFSSPFSSGSTSLSRPASLVKRSPIKTIKPQHVVFPPAKARTSPSVTSSGSSTSVPPDSSPSVRRGGSSSLRSLSSMTSAVMASRGWASDPVSKPERPGPMPSTGYTVRDSFLDEGYVKELKNWAFFQAHFLAALQMTKTRCPLCYMLDREDDRHHARKCSLTDCGTTAQRQFRTNSQNDWGAGEACFFCHLPQDICGRPNGATECQFGEHKDVIRGVLLLLTNHGAVRREAVKVASEVQPRYALPEPEGRGIMGKAWRKGILHGSGKRMYAAFPAVAVVILTLSGRF
ncbi:hypothetical protein CF319_g9337, partial [Tilletia indica]